MIDIYAKGFLNKILDGENDDVRKTIKILRSRGYLIDEADGKYYLSDNSHNHDITTLNKFLNENSIGYISGSLITIQNIVPLSILDKLYKNIYIGIEEHHNYAHYSWDMSFRRKYGEKVPAVFLEPYIARYVKAISSIGIMTYACCDGAHYNRKTSELYVMHQGIYDLYWHKIILNYYFDNILQNIKWEINKSKFDFKFSCNYIAEDAVEVFYQINKLAKEIYDNRIRLREIKMSIYDNLRFDINHNTYSEEEIYLKILNEFNKIQGGKNVII